VFLLAFSLMIVFVSYALQATHRPYMSADETKTIVAQAKAKAAGRVSVQVGTGRQMKSRLPNAQRSTQRSSAAKENMALARDEMWNYNNVEQTLLFTMCLILINAIMFQSDQIKANKKMELGLAAWTFILILGSLVYFLLVLVSELALGLGWLSPSRAQQLFGSHGAALAAGTPSADETALNPEQKAKSVFSNMNPKDVERTSELTMQANPVTMQAIDTERELIEERAKVAELEEQIKQMKREQSLKFSKTSSAKNMVKHAHHQGPQVPRQHAHAQHKDATDAVSDEFAKVI